ncbi:ribonucleoside diphosphate reductase beta subunit-like protein [Frog virus 3]|uniref:ribonucleoside-diphosphate reductase n=1 Tax=Frog virus 3 TaxID=10493 RepID=A0A5B8P0U6_FRG3V|nr:ribonucleoside diphosphate reductase beta subunit-like protein [Frog virus 3]
MTPGEKAFVSCVLRLFTQLDVEVGALYLDHLTQVFRCNEIRNMLMKGMGKVVEWSVRDENIHVEGVSKLFETLNSEYPWVVTKDLIGFRRLGIPRVRASLRAGAGPWERLGLRGRGESGVLRETLEMWAGQEGLISRVRDDPRESEVRPVTGVQTVWPE